MIYCIHFVSHSIALNVLNFAELDTNTRAVSLSLELYHHLPVPPNTYVHTCTKDQDEVSD